MPDGYDNEYDRARTPVRRTAESASLAEIVDVILDKGIVFDAWRRVSVPGLGPMTIKAHMVVASVDTLLRYAEEIGLSPLAAPAPGQQVTSGRENGQHAARQLPSGEENIVRRDQEHRLYLPEGQ